MAQSIEHATATRTVQCSNLIHTLLFGQNQGTCVSFEQIGEKFPVSLLGTQILFVLLSLIIIATSSCRIALFLVNCRCNQIAQSCRLIILMGI